MDNRFRNESTMAPLLSEKAFTMLQGQAGPVSSTGIHANETAAAY